MMRLFIGLPFSHQTRRELLLVQKGLQKNAVKGNFTSAGNFHLTLAFLGEVEAERLPAVFRALDAAALPSLDLTLSALDCFEGGIWHLVPRPCPPLTEGQGRLERTLRERGFDLAPRPYIPHVTLGRKILLREGALPHRELDRPISARCRGAEVFLSHRVEGELRYEILKA